jgi:hypothetical protein
MSLNAGILMQFSLGQTVITPTALAVLPSCQVAEALMRHASGDWGEVSFEDAAANGESLRLGGRLLTAAPPQSCFPKSTDQLTPVGQFRAGVFLRYRDWRSKFGGVGRRYSRA